MDNHYQQRVEIACRLAVGKVFTVKRWKDSNVTMTGTIISCVPAGTRQTPRRVYQLFKITLEANNPKGQFEYTVDQLPR
jgi:hypothetical protein